MVPLLLLVEDDPQLGEVLYSLFDGEGYTVRLASDGIHALAEISNHPPDVIVTDAVMPRLGGLGLIASLHSNGLHVPIILISANARDPQLEGVRFIPKPFEIDQLLDAVSSALDHG